MGMEIDLTFALIRKTELGSIMWFKEGKPVRLKLRARVPIRRAPKKAIPSLGEKSDWWQSRETQGFAYEL
jgi:hypothetical protein